MAIANLQRLLVALSTFTDLQRQFRDPANRERIMNEAGLSEAEKDLVRKKDVDAIKAMLGDTDSAATGVRLDF